MALDFFKRGNEEKAKKPSKNDIKLATDVSGYIDKIEPHYNNRYSRYDILKNFRKGLQWENQISSSRETFSIDYEDYGNYYYCKDRPKNMVQITFNRCGPVVEKFQQFLGIEQVEFHVPAQLALDTELENFVGEEKPAYDFETVRVDIIEKLGKLVLYIENDFKSMCKSLANDGATFGDAFFEATWNDQAKKIRIRRINPFNIKVSWKDDSFTELKMTSEEYWMNVDEAKKPIENGGLNKDGLLNGLEADKDTANTSVDGMVKIYNVWVDLGTQEKPKSRNIIMVSQDSKIVVKDKTVDLPFPVYYIPTTNIASEPFGMAFHAPGLQLQRQINDRLSDEAEIIRQYASPWIIDKNSGQDLKDIITGVNGPKIIPIDEDGDIKYLEWSGRIYPVEQHIQMLIQAFDDAVSMPKIGYGQIDTSIATGPALTASFQPTIMKIKDWTNNFNKEFRKLWKNILITLESKQDGAKDVIQGYYDVKVQWGERAPRDESLHITNVLNMKQAGLISDSTAQEQLGVPSPVEEQQQIKREKNDPDLNPELALQKFQALSQLRQTKAAQQGPAQQGPTPNLPPEMQNVPQPRAAQGVGGAPNEAPFEQPQQPGL